MSDIKNTKTFKCEIKIKRDRTAFGNKYWIQVEDTPFEDHDFLKELEDQQFKAIIVIEATQAEKGEE